jgi:hypothetical protein
MRPGRGPPGNRDTGSGGHNGAAEVAGRSSSEGDGIVIILAIALYVVAAWFATGTIGLAIWAVNAPSRRPRAALAAMAVMCALIAAVQVLAAGDLR